MSLSKNRRILLKVENHKVILKMSEDNKKKRIYLVVGLGVLVCSILLGYISIYIAFGEYDISRSTIINMLITSGVLFVVGIIILSLWAFRKKPDTQTSDDSN